MLVVVQLDEDKAKARKWPLAVAALWNERAVQGNLVVITADRAVAGWARTVGGMTGALGTHLTVQPVVGQITGDVAESLLDRAHPELAFFAAWTVHERYGPEAQAIVERARVAPGPRRSASRTWRPLRNMGGVDVCRLAGASPLRKRRARPL